MKSYELLREVFKKVGCKNVARELKLSLSLIHQWSRGRDGSSEATNPLDYMAELMRITGGKRLAQWVCWKAGGYFVFNPQCAAALPKDLLCAENEVTEDFGEMLTLISKAAKNKGISRKESESIRMEWERLKSLTEGFVKCCEQGDFQSLRTSTATGASPPTNGATRSREQF